MKTKTYKIFCIRKANRNEYVHGFVVDAQNVKEAKSKASDLVAEKLGAHAFRLTNGKLPGDGWFWDGLAKRRNTTPDEIMQSAYSLNGYALYN